MLHRGIYIHVPFCARKCPYCDFYSQKIDRSLFDSYTDAVIRQLESHPFLGADTLYFGGGTPALLPPHLLQRIIHAAKKHFVPNADVEITIEANPAMLKQQGYADLLQAGFNRLSLGVQSLNDRELTTLGRLHNAKSAVEAVQAAFLAGFQNISCDVMLCTPYQTPQSLQNTLQTLTELPITHISAYLLQIEEGTPFAQSDITEHCPDEDTQAQMYLDMVNILQQKGFIQYEISNFSKPGFSSRHNQKYWLEGEYLGCGPGAHSYLEQKRFFIRPDLLAYIANPFDFVEDGEGGSYEETVMLGLRLTRGICLQELEQSFGSGPIRQLTKNAAPFLKNNLLCLQDGRLFLTPEGCLISNSIIARLLN